MVTNKNRTGRPHAQFFVATALALLILSGCEPNFFQMNALRQYGGEGPPAGYDYTPITFAGPNGLDLKTKRFIHTRNPRVNDQSFVAIFGHLRTMRNLDLDLSYTDLTDASIDRIAKLDLLKLDLSGTQITARALLQLRGKPKLAGLTFTPDGATGPQVQELKETLKLPFSQTEEDNSLYLSAEPPTTAPTARPPDNGIL